MPFEELKARQSVMWGSAPFERIAHTIADMHEALRTDGRVYQSRTYLLTLGRRR